MHEIDLGRVTSASQAELLRLAKQYGLRQQGARGFWAVRKHATNPFTGQEAKPLKMSSGTASLRDALLKLIPVVEGYLASSRSRHAPVVVAGNVLTRAKFYTAYLEAPNPKANLATRKRNVADMERIIARVLGERTDPEVGRAEVITYELGETYLRKVKEEAEKLPTLLEADAAKRSANATLNHAQSLFAKAALANYRALRLPPVMREFADVMPLPVPPAPKPKPIGEEVLNSMLRAIEAERVARPGLWAAFQLMLRGGLRNGEAFAARRSWLAAEPGGYRIRLELATTRVVRMKGTEGGVLLPLDVGASLLALPQPDDRPEDEAKDPFLVPARHKTERWEIVYRALNDWLREHGVPIENGKIAYRLRKEFGRRLLTQELARLKIEARALEAAQAGLRHAKGSSITSAHYTGDAGYEGMAQPVAFGD